MNRLAQDSESSRGVTFTVRIVPRAASTEVVGDYDGALKIRIAAPPVEGAANRELIRFLAKNFRVPQNEIEIISGANSKKKRIRIQNGREAILDQLRARK